MNSDWATAQQWQAFNNALEEAPRIQNREELTFVLMQTFCKTNPMLEPGDYLIAFKEAYKIATSQAWPM